MCKLRLKLDKRALLVQLLHCQMMLDLQIQGCVFCVMVPYFWCSALQRSAMRTQSPRIAVVSIVQDQLSLPGHLVSIFIRCSVFTLQKCSEVVECTLYSPHMCRDKILKQIKNYLTFQVFFCVCKVRFYFFFILQSSKI